MAGRLDIEALRVFQAIVAQGGVTRAADHVALSQSAVSHKIRRLEDNLGCTLLSRRSGAPLLTETGTRLLDYANRILALHDEALLALGARPVTGNIKLGTTEDITSAHLARILGRFSRLCPGVSVRTHISQSLTLQQDLQDGRIDLAIMQVFTRDLRPSDIALFEDDVCWVRSADSTFDLTLQIPFLAYDDNCIYKKWLRAEAQTDTHQFRTALVCSSNAGLIASIEAGLGIALLARHHVTRGMKIIETPFPTPPAITYVIRTASGAGQEAVRALIEEVRRETSMTGVLPPAARSST